ncbi:hypothetical protein ACPXCE_08375 [Streptomyces sp. DT24]|uniref:hypothetical protein n=1 Tax=Streptomyces sp. DT24 TaxID=3416520 RepID=UPI003CE890D4
MIRTVGRGLLAGAAGTTALNVVTYADMALRGRPTSSAPETTVSRLADLVGRPVPGDDEHRGNRLSGLGALSGLLVGTGAGAVAAVTRRAGLRLPVWLGGVLTGALVMAATDAPMAGLKVSDPRTWSATDWVSDAVPHLVHGLVTYAAVVTYEDRR